MPVGTTENHSGSGVQVTPRACTNIGVQVFFGQNFVKTIATWSGFSAKGQQALNL